MQWMGLWVGLHVVDPFGVAVVVVGGGEGADVVAFAVIVPGDDFDVLGCEG